jgi:TPR repeat protein
MDMNDARWTDISRSLVSFVALALVTGCGSVDLFQAPVGSGKTRYDAQECVEHGLRYAPDPEGVREATVAFADACQEGEAAACSALGVMYELGRGFAVDTARARELYGAACSAHNARGCANLAALFATEASGAAGVQVATLQR